MFDFIKLVWSLFNGRKTAAGLTVTFAIAFLTDLIEVVGAWDTTAGAKVGSLVGEAIIVLGAIHKFIKGE